MLIARQEKSTYRRWRLLVTAVFFLFLGACSYLQQRADEQRALLQGIVSEGESAWQARDYVSAHSAYARALQLAPDDAQLSFRFGYVSEMIGNYSDAAGAYRAALKIKEIPASLHDDLTFRLALLEAFHLNNEKQVPLLLAKLPAESAYAADLQAVLALLAGDGRNALLALNQARSFPLTQELSSIILYHAARAYFLAGDSDRAIQNLYEAINRAGSSPITKDIEGFRDFLRSRPRR